MPAAQIALTWSSTGASDCTADGAWHGSLPPSGTRTVTAPEKSGIYTYIIVCSGEGGTVQQSTTLDVSPASGKIDHVVIVFQENRTPDNLFHGLPGADIANSGLNSKGQTVTLHQIPLANNYDLDHHHGSFVELYHDGRMNGADRIRVYCQPKATACPPADAAFAYVNPSDVAPYFQLAETYAFGDRMFQTNQGPSFPAHQFIISGTSAPSADSADFASELPTNLAPAPDNQTGCTAPSNQSVLLIDPQGQESSSMYPCFEHQTVMDLLDDAHISWNYYTPSGGSIWTGPNAIQHLRMGPDWNRVIVPQTQVLNDIASGNLAQVTWVIPDAQSSDHAPGNAKGPSWVASIINAVGSSSYWGSTAIFVTWDDWGGWYDHVPPRIYDSYEYGARVPLIVVSPYAKRGYVSHVTHDFGSILKFIEENFGLPTLGYADTRADDLQDCFDFSSGPRAYEVVPVEYNAGYFLSALNVPSGGPDDD
jgi:phospholipase C